MPLLSLLARRNRGKYGTMNPAAALSVVGVLPVLPGHTAILSPVSRT